MAIAESNNVKSKKNNDLIKGLKVNSLIIFFSGFGILIASFLVFLLIVKNVYGNFELSEILPSNSKSAFSFIADINSGSISSPYLILNFKALNMISGF